MTRRASGLCPRMLRPHDDPDRLLIFDLLPVNGEDVSRLRYRQRRELLDQLALAARAGRRRRTRSRATTYQWTLKQGLDGIVASASTGGTTRPPHWLNINAVAAGGGSPGRKHRSYSGPRRSGRRSGAASSGGCVGVV